MTNQQPKQPIPASNAGMELIRIVATTIVLLATGYVLGFRFEQGPVAALAFLVVPLLFGVAFAVLVTAVAVIRPAAR